jgi:hypothetical protein
VFTRANGLKIKEMDRVTNGLVAETHIKALTKTVKCMDLESMTGRLESFTKENGVKGIKKVMVYGVELLTISILENGETINHMDLESIFGVAVISTKASGSTASAMVRAVINLQTAILMSVSTVGEKLKGTEFILGATGILTVDSFIMDKRMDRAIGAKVIVIKATHTQENTSMIKNMDTESFCGELDQNTKEITLKMSKKVMEKCTGLMEAYIEASGNKAYNKD